MLLLICGLVAIVAAQGMKPWTEWTDKDVKKILDNSGWGQVQSESVGSNMSYNPSVDSMSRGSGANMNSQPDRPSGSERNGGAGNTSVQPSSAPTTVDYHIRLLSARPIREAIIRDLVIKRNQPATDPQKAFIEDKAFEQYTAVSIYVDGRGAGGAVQLLKNLKVDDVKGTTYLERKDGKRLTLQEVQPLNPSNNLGAIFFFPRSGDDGKPFVTNDGGVLKFYSEISPPEKPDQKKKQSPVKITAKFKTSEMMFGDKLEY
jgi:hypothetical protein